MNWPAAGFDVLTHVKGSWARSGDAAFTTVDFTAPDGTAHHYELAERVIELPVPARPAPAGQQAETANTYSSRQCLRGQPDG